MFLPRLSLLISFLGAAAASSLTIAIPPSTILPNPNVLPAGTHATLTSLPSGSPNQDQRPLTAALTRSATFVFRRLPSTLAQPESYLLDIRSAEYVFAPYRVDVAADGSVLGVWETFRGNEWGNRGTEKFVVDVAAASKEKSSVDVSIEAKVLGKRAFYEERAKFSPLSLFKNPMILLALVAMGFTFGMPKLMENMDPEMREEFEKQSRASPISGATRGAMGGGGPANFDLAGWMAGTTTPASGTGGGAVGGGGAAAAAASSGRESGGSAKRRG